MEVVGGLRRCVVSAIGGVVRDTAFELRPESE